MRYCVTGSAGFIGSHLVDALKARGHEIVGVDLRRSPWTDWPGSVTAKGFPNVVQHCDGIFHCAAVVGFANVMVDPRRTIQTELDTMRVVLETALRGKRPVVYTSSSAVYGRGTGAATETMDNQLGPTVTRSWSYTYGKAAAECLAAAAFQQDRIPVRIGRLFNVVGPRQSAAAGFVLPRFIEQAQRGDPLTVYSPGTQTRTFGAVQDITHALMALMDCPQAAGEVVNVGGTETLSMLQLATLVKGTLGSASPITVVAHGYGPGYDNVIDRKPNLEKITQLTGWEPTTPLRDVILQIAQATAVAA